MSRPVSHLDMVREVCKRPPPFPEAPPGNTVNLARYQQVLDVVMANVLQEGDDIWCIEVEIDGEGRLRGLLLLGDAEP